VQLEVLELSKLLLGSKSFPLKWFSMPLNSLVIQVQPGNRDCWAIERSVVSVCSCSGIFGGSVVIHVDVEEGIDGYHFAAHIVSPFQCLWTDVSEESIRRPSPENHYFCCGNVVDE
jgi:hypothetical protein